MILRQSGGGRRCEQAAYDCAHEACSQYGEAKHHWITLGIVLRIVLDMSRKKNARTVLLKTDSGRFEDGSKCFLKTGP